MSVLPAGSDVPEFTLRREDGEPFTRDDLAGKTTVLVFYPAAFSSVCTDQFQIYQEVLEDLAAQGADLYGVSIDQTDSQVAFRESLGVTIPMLSDAVPQAAATRAFGVALRADRRRRTARSSSSAPTRRSCGPGRASTRASCRARTSSSTGWPARRP